MFTKFQKLLIAALLAVPGLVLAEGNLKCGMPIHEYEKWVKDFYLIYGDENAVSADHLKSVEDVVIDGLAKACVEGFDKAIYNDESFATINEAHTAITVQAPYGFLETTIHDCGPDGLSYLPEPIYYWPFIWADKMEYMRRTEDARPNGLKDEQITKQMSPRTTCVATRGSKWVECTITISPEEWAGHLAFAKESKERADAKRQAWYVYGYQRGE